MCKYSFIKEERRPESISAPRSSYEEKNKIIGLDFSKIILVIILAAVAYGGWKVYNRFTETPQERYFRLKEKVETKIDKIIKEEKEWMQHWDRKQSKILKNPDKFDRLGKKCFKDMKKHMQWHDDKCKEVSRILRSMSKLSAFDDRRYCGAK